MPIPQRCCFDASPLNTLIAGDVVALGDGRGLGGEQRPFTLKAGDTVSARCCYLAAALWLSTIHYGAFHGITSSTVYLSAYTPDGQ